MLVVPCWWVILFLEILCLDHGLIDLAPKSILCFAPRESEQYFLAKLSRYSWLSCPDLGNEDFSLGTDYFSLQLLQKIMTIYPRRSRTWWLSRKVEVRLSDIDMSQVCHCSSTPCTLQQLSRVTQEEWSKTKNLMTNWFFFLCFKLLNRKKTHFSSWPVLKVQVNSLSSFTYTTNTIGNGNWK